MKKMMQKYLALVIIVGMVFAQLLNYTVQFTRAQRDMEEQTYHLFWQIEHIFDELQMEIQQEKADFQEIGKIRARAAAYMIQQQPSAIKNRAELEKIAALLQVDELHIFNTEGTIYAGTEPRYYGYNFRSGKQMEFFLPMLQDKQLELCQEVTPNTAEQKMMQYAAVWQENGENIIQIGITPDRALKITKGSELSYIFSLLTDESGATLYAVDAENYTILGATNRDMVGQSITALGLTPAQIAVERAGFHANVSGKACYCVFEQRGRIILGRVCTNVWLYRHVTESGMYLVLYLLIISLVMFLVISRYLEEKVVHGIADINGKLQVITDGNLEEQVNVNSTPEFAELSGHINQMVDSLLHTTDKLSTVLDAAEAPIGIFEYNAKMGRVQATARVADILNLSEKEKEHLLSNHVLFEEKLQMLRRYPVDETAEVYQLPCLMTRYIKLETFQQDDSVTGILMDVTRDFTEKQRLEQELDEDILTGLHSRRAFYTHMEELFQQPESLGHAVMIMIDADNLKRINDDFGHQSGDRYLRGIAEVLAGLDAPQQIITRLSGDEFALLLYGCASRQELEQYVAQLREKQNGYLSQQVDGDMQVYFSLGCAYYPEDGADYHTLLKSADYKMYEEKRIRKKEVKK